MKKILFFILLSGVLIAQTRTKNITITRGDNQDVEFSTTGDYTSGYDFRFVVKASRTLTASRLIDLDSNFISASYTSPKTTFTVSIPDTSTRDFTSLIYEYDLAVQNQSTNSIKTLYSGEFRIYQDVWSPFDDTDSLTDNTVRYVPILSSNVDTGEYVYYNGSFVGDTMGVADISDFQAQLIIDSVKTVDGTGSGLDADLLDGKSEAEFANLSENETFTGAIDFTGGLKYNGTSWLEMLSDSIDSNSIDASQFAENDIIVSNGTVFENKSPTEYWDILRPDTMLYYTDNDTAAIYGADSRGDIRLRHKIVTTSGESGFDFFGKRPSIFLGYDTTGIHDTYSLVNNYQIILDIDTVYQQYENSTKLGYSGAGDYYRYYTDVNIDGNLTANSTLTSLGLLTETNGLISDSLGLAVLKADTSDFTRLSNLGIYESQILDLTHFVNADETDQIWVGDSSGYASKYYARQIASDTASYYTDQVLKTTSSPTFAGLNISTDSYISTDTAKIAGLIYTNGTKVGLGTTSPQQLLHVAGATRLDGTIYLNNNVHYISSGEFYVARTTAQGGFVFNNTFSGELIFKTNNSERLRINSSGNVGIGKTTNIDSSLSSAGGGWFEGGLLVGKTFKATDFDFSAVTTDSTTVSTGEAFRHNGYIRYKK